MSGPERITAEGVLGEGLALTPYRLTFGTRYAHEPHPSGAQWVDPSGWVEIRAEDEEAARRIAFELFGPAWAFLYDTLRTLEPHHYPLGRLAVVHQMMNGRCAHCRTQLLFRPGWELVHFDTLSAECHPGTGIATVAELGVPE